MQLVHGLRDGREPLVVRRLMLERRRMLAELGLDATVPQPAGSMGALCAAVAESDHTLEALLG